MMKMCFLLKLGTFQPAMLVYQSEYPKSQAQGYAPHRFASVKASGLQLENLPQLNAKGDEITSAEPKKTPFPVKKPENKNLHLFHADLGG